MLFLGYFEESHFQSAHYQSVVPVMDSKILDIVKENGGFDIAAHFGFDTTPATEDLSSGQFFLMYFLCTFDY